VNNKISKLLLFSFLAEGEYPPTSPITFVPADTDIACQSTPPHSLPALSDLDILIHHESQGANLVSALPSFGLHRHCFPQPRYQKLSFKYQHNIKHFKLRTQASTSNSRPRSTVNFHLQLN
jgi:hypothetical protein